MCARTLWPLLSSTRNIALGRASTTVPSISITPSFFGMSSAICCWLVYRVVTALAARPRKLGLPLRAVFSLRSQLDLASSVSRFAQVAREPPRRPGTRVDLTSPPGTPSQARHGEHDRRDSPGHGRAAAGHHETGPCWAKKQVYGKPLPER